jgi:hypothetical protein
VPRDQAGGAETRKLDPAVTILQAATSGTILHLENGEPHSDAPSCLRKRFASASADSARDARVDGRRGHASLGIDPSLGASTANRSPVRGSISAS